MVFLAGAPYYELVKEREGAPSFSVTVLSYSNFTQTQRDGYNSPLKGKINFLVIFLVFFFTRFDL